MAISKDLRILLREARAQGFEVTATNKCHFQVRGPGGGLAHIGGRSIRKARAELCRIGLRCRR